jgi:hypothetical protein
MNDFLNDGAMAIKAVADRTKLMLVIKKLSFLVLTWIAVGFLVSLLF